MDNFIRPAAHVGIQQSCDQLKGDQHDSGIEVDVALTLHQAPDRQKGGRSNGEGDQGIQAWHAHPQCTPARPVKMGAGISDDR